MGRQTKRSDGVVRKITYPVRFAEDEYQQIQQKAKTGRISVSEFIRRAALRRKVTEDTPPPQLNRQLYEQLSQINEHLTQIQKCVNLAIKQGEPIPIDPDNLQNIIQQLSIQIKETQKQLLLNQTNNSNQRNPETTIAQSN